MTQRTANGSADRVSAPTWTGRCTGCSGDGLKIASRREHGERVLCARCAERPAKPWLAVPDRSQDHHPGLHQVADGSTVERDEDGQIVSVYVNGDVWAQWEADRRRRVAKDRADRPARLADLEAKLAAAGLRPVVDRPLGLLRCECPDCRAGQGDPLGLYRPLVVVPRANRVLVCCDACKAERVEHG